MATRPIICPPVPANGFIFYKDKFVLEEDYNKTTFIDFSDMLDDVVAYSRMRITLKSGKSVKISQTDLGDDNGYVRWIAVKVKYPEPKDPILYGAQVPIIPGVPTPTNGTPQVRKYIEWTYQGVTYNVGELMILTGNKLGSTNSTKSGWNLSEATLPYNNGGIVFSNPHSNIDVKLELLIAR
jgi:hypothetical protein